MSVTIIAPPHTLRIHRLELRSLLPLELRFQTTDAWPRWVGCEFDDSLAPMVFTCVALRVTRGDFVDVCTMLRMAVKDYGYAMSPLFRNASGD
jgi:hypothetical protein